MKENEFRIWMGMNQISKKLQTDCVTRLKRVEKELDQCNLDDHYIKDECNELLSCFSKMGKNENMAKYGNVNLPIGKYYMSTYTLAIKKYVQFMHDSRK